MKLFSKKTSNSNNTPYFVGFSYMLGIGPVRFKTLLQNFGNAKKAYYASIESLKPILGEKLAKEFDKFRNKFKADSTVQELYKKNIHIIPFGSSLYPSLLSNIPDPPICLYLKGDPYIFSKNSIFFSVVGSRNNSQYGKFASKLIIPDLVKSGFVIVSGLALGIDAYVHEIALRENGLTVAVLGCGVEVIYPPQNAHIYEKIIKNKGAVISEFPPTMRVQKGHFVSRNRIISGISKGVLVIEGTEKSGTLITASYAALQGRDVFAIPGQITSDFSKAPNILIQQGAKAVLSSFDILCEYKKNCHFKEIKNNFDLSLLTENEKKIINELKKQNNYPNDISKSANLPIEEVLRVLSKLELIGCVSKNNDGSYLYML